MIDHKSSPEHYTASMLYRFNKKKNRLAQLETRIDELTKYCHKYGFDMSDFAHLYLLQKRQSIARAMKEVLLSEILKYKPQS